MQPNSLLEVRKSRSSAGEATPAALASALLRARDVAEIAAIGVLHAELRFGLQHARVVWSAALPHLAASPTRSVPEDVLRSREQILVQGL
ncbi:MAG: hypothetical protein KA911_07030, partial [Xanthomonadales bacterium]|nr:hypothetical protein [Xanthomonadales bacterium]